MLWDELYGRFWVGFWIFLEGFSSSPMGLWHWDFLWLIGKFFTFLIIGDWMWGIFHIILSVPHNTIMDMNDVTIYNMVDILKTQMSGRGDGPSNHNSRQLDDMQGVVAHLKTQPRVGATWCGQVPLFHSASMIKLYTILDLTSRVWSNNQSCMQSWKCHISLNTYLATDGGRKVR